MSAGEQSGVSSLTRTNSAVHAVARNDCGDEANGVGARVDDRDLPDQRDAERVPAGLPSSVIHELRTPLTSIHGYAQVLQRTFKNEPRASNALAVVVRETTRLSAMLAELSELAEIDAGDMVVAPIEIEVQQIVDGVVHEIERRDGGAHPILIEGSGVARCNPTILSQVLRHVLTNAVRYSPAGAQVDVRVRQRGSRVEIVVADRGISVEPEDARRIYEPFERGSNARQFGVRGLGLGLYLARRQLAAAGGRIEHRPRDEGGTVFRITVPGA
jgi:signal transduction histidine kinase